LIEPRLLETHCFNTLGAGTVCVNHVSCITKQLYNLPADYARELFKRSKDVVALPVWILKMDSFGFWDVCCVGDVISGVGLGLFG